MKNLKFGAFFAALVLVVAALVTAVSAQNRVQVEPRRERGQAFILDGRGAVLGARVSDLDVKATTGPSTSLGTSGVRVDEVHEDSPAEKAGIKAGDIVVDYDGERVRSARQFTRLVQETPEGRTVAIGLMRDGKKQTVNVTPEAGRMTWDFRWEPGSGNREPEFHMRELPDFNFNFRDFPRRFEYRLPDEFRFPAPGSRIPGRSRGRLGVSVQSITPELAEYFGAKNGGALVSSVTRDSAAAKAGIKAGDVIVSVNGRTVTDADDLIDELEDIDPSTSLGAGGEATIVVVRDKKEMTLKAALDKVR